MSKNSRHEIISNGYNNVPDPPQPAMLVRQLVLDSNYQMRPVYKLFKAFLDRNCSTTQMAYKNDILLVKKITLNQETNNCTTSMEYFRLDGPMEVAAGAPTLVRKPLTPEEIQDLVAHTSSEEYDELFDFLHYAAEHVTLNDIHTLDSILPPHDYWDGDIGVIEEKQAAYISDLLGGAPVRFIEDMAWHAIHVRRNYIDPFDVITGLPPHLDWTNRYIGKRDGLEIGDAVEAYWVLFTDSGDTVIVNRDQMSTHALYQPQHVKSAVKLLVKPFLTEHNEHYGLIVETYRPNKSNEKEDPSDCWENHHPA